MRVSIGCIGMIDLILVILILAVAAVAFNLEARRKGLRRRQVERLERLQKLCDETGDAGTIDLIGEQAYRDMTARIDGILERHGHQPCLTLNLSCGPDTDKGSDELHTLLPGEQVEIVPCSEGGVEWYDVYFNGARVGRFVLAEASLLRETLRDNHVRGAYVAEQNCYKIEDSHQLKVILFYEPKAAGDAGALRRPSRASRSAKSDTATIDICQN